MSAGGVIGYDTLTPGIHSFGPKLFATISTFVEYQAPNVQDYAREHAPWTDRTGNARGGLFARAENKPPQFSIILYHTVPYGIWLEVAHDRQYRIIEPTIQAEGKRIMAALNKLIARLG